MPEEIEIKSYKVLKQIGWQGSTYFEGDTVEMEPRFAEYYLNEKVLKGSNDTATPEVQPPPQSPTLAPIVQPSQTPPITESEAS